MLNLAKLFCFFIAFWNFIFTFVGEFLRALVFGLLMTQVLWNLNLILKNETFYSDGRPVPVGCKLQQRECQRGS